MRSNKALNRGRSSYDGYYRALRLYGSKQGIAKETSKPNKLLEEWLEFIVEG